MSSSPSTPSSSDSVQNSRLRRAARTAAALARRLRTAVAILACSAAGAGLLIWVLLWWPPVPQPLSLLGAGATMALLLSPAVVLALFVQGLHDLLALPDRLAARTTETVNQSADAVEAATQDASGGVLGRLWTIVRQIWALRTVLSENRALLLRYGALLRFLTPGFLLLVVLAAGLSLLLVPIAVVAGLGALLW